MNKKLLLQATLANIFTMTVGFYVGHQATLDGSYDRLIGYIHEASSRVGEVSLGDLFSDPNARYRLVNRTSMSLDGSHFVEVSDDVIAQNLSYEECDRRRLVLDGMMNAQMGDSGGLASSHAACYLMRP